MYGTRHHEDVVKGELEYCVGRVQDGIVGHRRRRSNRRGGEVDHATFATAARSAILLQGR